MFFKHALNVIIRDNALGAQLAVHGTKLTGESFAEIIPENGILPIEYLGIINGVGIFQVVGENEGAFVVDADGGIEVVGKQHDFLFERHLFTSSCQRVVILCGDVDENHDNEQTNHQPHSPASSSGGWIAVPIKLGNIFFARESIIRNSSVNR